MGYEDIEYYLRIIIHEFGHSWKETKSLTHWTPPTVDELMSDDKFITMRKFWNWIMICTKVHRPLHHYSIRCRVLCNTLIWKLFPEILNVTYRWNMKHETWWEQTVISSTIEVCINWVKFEGEANILCIIAVSHPKIFGWSKTSIN